MVDNLTPQQRSYCMSCVKGKDTGLEVRVRSALHKKGLRFRKHVHNLPGNPDIVFPRARVAVFVDGDFWHGYRFALWEYKVSDFWKKKINKNRARDAVNHRKLRRMGWAVIRLWQHDIEKDFDTCIDQIITAVFGVKVSSESQLVALKIKAKRGSSKGKCIHRKRKRAIIPTFPWVC
ncbi:MAG: very short patch repair endonuclease [Lentisphaerae bacterium]|nr:very short patch repair endonuclease [Lentisphaerota bacterium]